MNPTELVGSQPELVGSQQKPLHNGEVLTPQKKTNVSNPFGFSLPKQQGSSPRIRSTSQSILPSSSEPSPSSSKSLEEIKKKFESKGEEEKPSRSRSGSKEVPQTSSPQTTVSSLARSSGLFSPRKNSTPSPHQSPSSTYTSPQKISPSESTLQPSMSDLCQRVMQFALKLEQARVEAENEMVILNEQEGNTGYETLFKQMIHDQVGEEWNSLGPLLTEAFKKGKQRPRSFNGRNVGALLDNYFSQTESSPQLSQSELIAQAMKKGGDDLTCFKISLGFYQDLLLDVSKDFIQDPSNAKKIRQFSNGRQGKPLLHFFDDLKEMAKIFKNMRATNLLHKKYLKTVIDKFIYSFIKSIQRAKEIKDLKETAAINQTTAKHCNNFGLMIDDCVLQLSKKFATKYQATSDEIVQNVQHCLTTKEFGTFKADFRRAILGNFFSIHTHSGPALELYFPELNWAQEIDETSSTATFDTLPQEMQHWLAQYRSDIQWGQLKAGELHTHLQTINQNSTIELHKRLKSLLIFFMEQVQLDLNGEECQKLLAIMDNNEEDSKAANVTQMFDRFERVFLEVKEAISKPLLQKGIDNLGVSESELFQSLELEGIMKLAPLLRAFYQGILLEIHARTFTLHRNLINDPTVKNERTPKIITEFGSENVTDKVPDNVTKTMRMTFDKGQIKIEINRLGHMQGHRGCLIQSCMLLTASLQDLKKWSVAPSIIISLPSVQSNDLDEKYMELIKTLEIMGIPFKLDQLTTN